MAGFHSEGGAAPDPTPAEVPTEVLPPRVASLSSFVEPREAGNITALWSRASSLLRDIRRCAQQVRERALLDKRRDRKSVRCGSPC
jgi:hypothetical protein